MDEMRANHGTPSSVWIVEDNRDYRDTVLTLIDLADDLVSPRGFGSGEELVKHLNQNFAPDLIIVDIGLPGMTGIEVVRRVRHRSPNTRLMMLTIHEDSGRIFDAICAGACGYLLKTAKPDEILSGIREALKGGAPMTPEIARRVLDLVAQKHKPAWDYSLTDRELEVLQELVNGKTKKRIGEALFVTEHTIDTHLRNIYAKLHVRSQVEAAVKAVSEGLASPNGGR